MADDGRHKSASGKRARLQDGSHSTATECFNVFGHQRRTSSAKVSHHARAVRARHGRTPTTTGIPTCITEPRPCHPTPSRRVARFRQLAVNTVASSKTDHVFQFGVQHRPEVSAPPEEREPKEPDPRAPSPEPTVDPLALAVDLLSASPQVQIEPPPTEPPPTHERSEELFSAVGDGDAAALGALLEAGVPATCVDDDGCTPLIHAAEGESACVELLLPRSAGHINRRSADGTTGGFFIPECTRPPRAV